jgi:hypothetical protein
LKVTNVNLASPERENLDRKIGAPQSEKRNNDELSALSRFHVLSRNRLNILSGDSFFASFFAYFLELWITELARICAS